jgi:hypothetical protein
MIKEKKMSSSATYSRYTCDKCYWEGSYPCPEHSGYLMVDADSFCGISSKDQMICGANINSSDNTEKWEYCPYCGRKIIKTTTYTNNCKSDIIIYYLKK